MGRLLKIFQVLALVLVSGTAASAGVVQITPDVAREQALAGKLVLIDIRRPDEWAQTGVADVALLADMTQQDFVAKINAIRMQSPDIPLAFICRSGSRSGYVTTQLDKMGWSGIIDVVGGMSGSGVDRGWIRRDLPLRDAGAPVNPAVGVTQP